MTREQLKTQLETLVYDKNKDFLDAATSAAEDALGEAKNSLLRSSVRDAESDMEYVDVCLDSSEVDNMSSDLASEINALVDEFFDGSGIVVPPPSRFNVGDIVDFNDGIQLQAGIVLAEGPHNDTTPGDNRWLIWSVADHGPVFLFETDIRLLVTTVEMSAFIEERASRLDAVRSQKEPEDQPSTTDSTSA